MDTTINYYYVMSFDCFIKFNFIHIKIPFDITLFGGGGGVGGGDFFTQFISF